MVELLTINSFLFPFPHQIIGGLDVLLNLIVISYFDYFSDFSEPMAGNFPAVLMNHRNLHDWHKVFQVAHENRDCTQSIWIIFAVLFNFHRGKKRENVTNCGNGSWKSLLSHSLTNFALKEKQKYRHFSLER